ncbi:uncharacterized protein LOC127060440 [Serinus canaria]|uniref:uncharacterized protein LOC127060440 n=1 Tax=Serinus canaria TaxID=9135 RepID=UPI0021CCE444|nr:uncharacterized protein LOC127060440 [Serinus canaria]XP_050839648.1 uncharacterized protein LOC127060440 [Serinus canaria]
MMPFKTFKALVQSNEIVPGNTPLGCLVGRWKSEGFDQDKLRKGKMIDFCNHLWPLYASEGGPEWLLNGTIDHAVITPLMQYLRKNKKWEEIPYLDLFYYLGQKTEWQKECGIMMLEVQNDEECLECKKKNVCVSCAVKANREEEDLSLCIAASAPPLELEERERIEISKKEYEDLEEDDGDDQGEGDDDTESLRTPGVSRAKVTLRPQTPSPGSSRSVQRTPLAALTRQGRRNQGEPHMIAPLREAVGPQGERVLIKVPFSLSDLVIWKQTAGSYREDPERTACVVKMVIKTQDPDWNDLQVLLDTLMDSTEKDMVMRAAKERAREAIRAQRLTGVTVGEIVPTDDPGWDPNSIEGHQRLKKFQELSVRSWRENCPHCTQRCIAHTSPYKLLN